MNYCTAKTFSQASQSHQYGPLIGLTRQKYEAIKRIHGKQEKNKEDQLSSYQRNQNVARQQ